MSIFIIFFYPLLFTSKIISNVFLLAAHRFFHVFPTPLAPLGGPGAANSRCREGKCPESSNKNCLGRVLKIRIIKVWHRSCNFICHFHKLHPKNPEKRINPFHPSCLRKILFGWAQCWPASLLHGINLSNFVQFSDLLATQALPALLQGSCHLSVLWPVTRH